MLDKIPERALEIDLGNIFYVSGHIFYIVNFRKMAKYVTRNINFVNCLSQILKFGYLFNV